MPIDDDQRARLRQAKLRALLRDRFDDPVGALASYPSGAAFVSGDHAWVLVDGATERSAGGPVLWATRGGVVGLDVLLDHAGPDSSDTDSSDTDSSDTVSSDTVSSDTDSSDTDSSERADLAGHLARRLSLFDPPAQVWTIDGLSVAPVHPSPVAAPRPQPAGAETLVGLLESAGLDVVVEDGIVRGEELGLEVARIVADPDLDWRLEVGVGQFDQAAAAMMYAEKPTAEALEAVVGQVRRYRFPGAPIHPVRDLCRERWIRHMVQAEPSLVGATTLHAVESTVPRRNLRQVHPAFAVGTSDGGGALVVGCTDGVDVDLLPLAADVREREAPEAELVVVSTGPLPPSVHALAGRLPGTVRFVEVAPPWIVR